MNIVKQDPTIPRRPLILLAMAMLFTVPPMFGNLAAWVPASFLAVLLVRFFMERRGAHLRSRLLKGGLMAAGIGGVAMTYHMLIGPEPGLSICLVLIAVKVLEAHTARDFHILALLGWFFCLAVVLISQTLAAAVYSGIAFALVLASVLQFYSRAAGRGGWLAPLRDTAVLMLQAAPFVVVLFFLFPRGAGGYRFLLNRSFSGRTGMSGSLSPGSIASLALSDEVAFRVEFPEGGMPAAPGLYWRGAVFTNGDGLDWKPDKADLVWRNQAPLSGTPVHQRISLQPHGNRWIFALDKPVRAPRGTTLARGHVLLANKAVYSTFQYDVTSLPGTSDGGLQPVERKLCLRVPVNVSPAIRTLARVWTQDGANPRTVVERGLHFFQNGRFRYSLMPGTYGADGLEDFLFRRRTGFCEHFAASFATLMRLAGVPSRVVVGYQGGEFNRLGQYLVVRQSDAHAWCEVWIEGKGWMRVDPTAMVAPERVNLGFDSYFETRVAAGAEAAAGRIGTIGMAFRRRGILHDIELAWETLNYQWDTHVAAFDEEAQQSFLMQLGFSHNEPATLLFGWLALIGSVVIGIQTIAAWRRARPVRDPLVVLYERFCRRAAVLGAKREPWEGPVRFAERAARLLPDRAECIRHAAALYASLRYSAAPDRGEQSRLAREIRKL